MTSADRMEQQVIIKFCVKFGKKKIETKQMVEETGKTSNLFEINLSTNDTSEFLLERAIVPFNQTVNAAKISQVNQKLQCYTKIVPTTQHHPRLCNLYRQCT